jgi:hypothetical protein
MKPLLVNVSVPKFDLEVKLEDELVHVSVSRQTLNI